MTFWDSFADSYKTSRAEQRARAHRLGRGWARKSGRATRMDDLKEALRERDAELTKAKEEVSELAGEIRELEEELKISRRSMPPGVGEDRYRKLRRAIVKKVHPDRAYGDPRLAAVLESMCKDINAEIDRIDAS